MLAVLAVAAVVAVAIAIGRGGGDPIEERVAELQAQEEARNAEQVQELTDLAIAVHGDLLPVMDGLHTVLPVDAPPASQPAAPQDLAAWRAAVDGAAAAFGDPPSASTGVNLARNGLMLSVDLLDSALTAYESSLAVDDPQAATLAGLAADLRMRAVDAWTVAATHLDELNIAAGHGHVHVYLPARPGEDMVDPHGG